MFDFIDTLAKRVLPSFLYGRLIGNWNQQGLKKYSANTTWIFLGKGFTMVVSFFMIAYVSRYLGPTNLGNLSYAQSFVAIFSMFASLGINNIYYRDLVANPERENEILGTALGVKLFFGCLTSIVTIGAGYLTSTDPTITLLIAILSLSFIIDPLGITVNVFAARALSKYATLTQMIVSASIQLLKLLMIFLGQGIVWFAAIIIFEVLLGSLLSLYFYIHTLRRNPFTWTFSRTYARTLTLVSLPLLFAGVSGYIFARIDQVMLMHLSDATSVGLYQSAVQITELLGNFIPGIVIASIVPALINAKKDSEYEYFHRMRQLLVFIGALSFTIVAGIFISSSILIHILYGTQFMGATGILRIYIWSSFIYMGIIVLQQHLINNDHTLMFLFLSMSTAGLNILLNFILIPLYGGDGAAIASVISLILYLVLPLIHPTLRKDYFRLFSATG